MSKNTITIDFLTQNPDLVMRKLETRGEWTAPSEIYNTGYCAIKGHFTILRSSYGVMAMPVKDLRKLIEELTEYAEILEYRKCAGVKGA